MKKKIGRNDPCPCGSGKKFKKCCESKMIGKKYMAHKIESADQTSDKISSFASLISSSVLDADKHVEKKINLSTTVESSKNEEKENIVKESEQPKEVAQQKVVKKQQKKKTTSKSS